MDEKAAATKTSGGDGESAPAPASSPSAGAQGSQPAECVVCYAAAADVLLPVCGHVALCRACRVALLAREDEGVNAAACPVCRAPLRRVVLPAPAQSGCYVPPQPRLDALLRLCAGEPGVESLSALPPGDDAAGDDEYRRSRDAVRRALHALHAYVEHSSAQMELALQAGAVDAACRAMCVAALDPDTQMFGSILLSALGLSTLASDGASAALRAACERTRAHDVALHALRCMHGGGAADEQAAEAMHALLVLLRAVPPRRWLGRQAAAVARLACAMCAANAGSGGIEHIALALLVQLVMLTHHAGTRTTCVLEAVRTLQSVCDDGYDDDDADTICVHLALKMLHDALVELSSAKTLRRSGSGAAAHAALCASALQAGAVPALLAAAARLRARASEDNAQRCALQLLPALREVCTASPAALRAALRAGIVPALAQLLNAYKEHPRLTGAVCELLAHILPPAADTRDAAAAAAAAAAAGSWRAVRSDAFAAATASQMMERAAAVACIYTQQAQEQVVQLLDESVDERTKPRICQAACDAMLAAGHALRVYAGMLHHGAPAAWANEVAASSSELCRHACVIAIAISCLEMVDGGGPLDMCGQRSVLHGAACCAMAALMRAPPPTAAREEERADADAVENGERFVNKCCAHVVHTVLANLPPCDSCPCARCDAAQAAACALLAQLAVACGGSTSVVQRAMRSANETCPPVAARLTALTQQTRLPAVRREALRTLALLLAMHVSTPAAHDEGGGGGEDNDRRRAAAASPPAADAFAGGDASEP
jgi:hypothetical protein